MQRKNLPGRKCRLAVYQRWALKLLKARVGFRENDESPKYGWPKSFLNYIRALEPDNVAAEDEKATYQVSYEELCTVLEIPKKST